MPRSSGKTILVTGATGKQGGAVVRHLQQRNFHIRAFTRAADSPGARALVGHGAEVVQGSLDDPQSVARAVDGADGVFSVQAFQADVENEVREGINLADAANRAGAGQFVYSSVGSADQKTGIPHFDSKFRIEEHIRNTGLAYTILRPVFFMENWLGMKEQAKAGKISLPLSPSTKLQMIAVDDIGAFAAMAFEKPGQWRGRATELAGDEATMADVAAAFGRILGQQVDYEQAPWEQFEQNAGHELTVMYRWFEEVGYHAEIPALRAIHPQMITFERWLRSTWQPA